MIKKIDERSRFVGKEELEIFKLPATQLATERSKYLSIYPKNGVSETIISSPIIFEITGVPDYLDLSKNFLKIKFQIRRDDGSAIDNDDVVAPVNYISNSFIQQMKIFINNKLVSDSSDTYTYRSFIETLTNFSSTVKNTHLQLRGWYEDEIPAGQTTIDHETNPGFVKRRELSAGSRTFEVLAPLHADLFNQTNYMIPNIMLRIELLRSPHDKVVTKLGGEPARHYRLHIKNIEWNVRVVEVNSQLWLNNEKRLQKESANYQINRTVVKSHPPQQTTQDVRNLEIYNGQLPTSMIIGFVTSASFHGNEGNSPFYFQPFGLERAQAVVGGRRWPSERPLQLNIADNILTEAYFQFLANSGFGDSFQDSNGVTMQKYKTHNFLLAFDFRSDGQDDDNSIDFLKQGETRIFLRFRAGLAQPTHMIAYLNFDNILKMDIRRNAVMDYPI